MAGYIAYEIAIHGVRGTAALAAPFDRRLRSAVQARREAPARFERWAAAQRDRGRPLFWLHAPSVGEALMAQAVIGHLREAVSGCQVAFTWFSLSAERVAGQVGADITACLPWDLRGDTRRALRALAPDVIGFVRTEVWPVLLREARARGVRTALLNAPLAVGSSRLRPVGRRFLSAAYGMLDAVGAVSAADAERLLRLSVRPERVRVTGDARIDQILGRLERTPGDAAIARFREPGVSVIVAGSTWPADEDRLVPACRTLRIEERLPVRLIIAPHQPTPSHLGRLEAALGAAALGSVRLADAERGKPLEDVLIVDRVGVLADLYRIADVAWVGGGFGGAGLHSILEPAALGVPVVYGPRFGNAGEAEALAAAGGGFVATDAASIAQRVRSLLADGGRAGAAAQAWVESQRGGAARNAELLAGLLREEGREAAAL